MGDWSPDDFPPDMIYQGDPGPAWNQIGPANFEVKWKGDVECLERIAVRRFVPQLEGAIGATAVRVDPETVQVSILYRAENPA
jgi:hypothetical protein